MAAIIDFNLNHGYIVPFFFLWERGGGALRQKSIYPSTTEALLAFKDGAFIRRVAIMINNVISQWQSYMADRGARTPT